MKMAEFLKTHDFIIDYITFYEDAINFFLLVRLNEVYGNKKLKKLVKRFLGKYPERRIAFFPTDFASAPPFVITLKPDNYNFSYEFDEYKPGDILIKTDHVTMTSIGLKSISILRALIEERLEYFPVFPLFEKIRLARIFDLKIF